MDEFKLDSRLARDCHVLGKLDGSYLLLMDNVLYPWLILVPETTQTQFHRLASGQQQQLLEQMNQLCRFIENHFQVSKLNTGCIGNIVSQLHIHMVGRHQADACWPGVVWGQADKQAYPLDEVQRISQLLQGTPDLGFTPFECQAKS